MSRLGRKGPGRTRRTALPVARAGGAATEVSPAYMYRSRCRDHENAMYAGPTKPIEERRAAIERAKAHAAQCDITKSRHRLAAGRLEVAIAAEERMLLSLMLFFDQRDQIIQQRDRHFDQRQAQRDRHHAERMNRNALPTGPTIINNGVIFQKVIKGVDGDRL